MEDMSFLVSAIIEWKKQYGNVFVANISGKLFVFRSLTRKEFKEIYHDDRIKDTDKEEEFCRIATLYPDDYDFETCPAGIPTVLADAILDNSLLKMNGKAQSVLDGFRDEMKQYENQISVIITEAFPSLTLEEVESWPLEKILYHLSRAEFVLNKMRNLPFVSQGGQVYDDIDEYRQDIQQYGSIEQEASIVKQNNVQEKQQHAVKPKNNTSLQELEDLKRRFPEIDWENDSILTGEFKFENDPTVTMNAEDVYE